MQTVTTFGGGIRRNPRYTFQCPATLTPSEGAESSQAVTIVEISSHGFQARAPAGLHEGQRWTVKAEIATGIHTEVQAQVVRRVVSESGQLFGFKVDRPDPAWERCVAWLQAA